MKISDLKQMIKARFEAGVKRSIFIEASPGVGKSQVIEQLAGELNVGFKLVHAPLLQPEDYGFPVIGKDKTHVDFVVSTEIFPIEGSDCPETGIFFIDEMSQADNSAQKILANVVQARTIHGRKIKAGWLIIAAGNRTADRAGANRVLTHLKNRFTSVSLEVDLDGWCEWALDHGVKPEVISFIRFRPELLNKFDANAEVNATPRAWAEGVSASLGVVNPLHEFEVFTGDVGEGPATELLAFLKIYRKLPTIDAILLDTKGHAVPKEPATLFALAGALSRKATPENFGRIVEYTKRMPTPFYILFVRDAIKVNPAIQTTKAFIAWAAKDGAKILA